MPYGLVLQYLVKIFIHIQNVQAIVACLILPHLYINVIAITDNHKTLLVPGLIEYFELAISLCKYDSDHKQVQNCGNAINVKM